MRPIDADAAIDTLKELTANGTNKGMVFGEDAVHRIEILPSVQPDIIYCKDCKHYREYSGVVDGCCNMAEWYRRYQYPEDFCSRAERREE